MPSNNELIKSIREVCEQKGIETPNVEGLNNVKLVELLSDLRKLKSDNDIINGVVEEVAEAVVEEVAEAVVEEVVECMVIAAGKAITTMRGVISDGKEIKPSDLAGGETAFNAFKKLGYIVSGTKTNS